VSGDIFVRPEGVRGAAGQIRSLAGRTQEAAGTFDTSCAIGAALGDPELTGVFSEFTSAWNDELDTLQSNTTGLATEAEIAAGTYVMNDTSVMPFGVLPPAGE
jgi:hypothetical protein